MYYTGSSTAGSSYCLHDNIHARIPECFKIINAILAASMLLKALYIISCDCDCYFNLQITQSHDNRIDFDNYDAVRCISLTSVNV